MKKTASLLALALLLSACKTLSPSESAAVDLPSTAQLSAYLLKQPAKTVTPAPPGLADGEHTLPPSSNGRYMKTVVRNGILDDYVDIYYPDGRLHSHTPLVNGIPQGWSEGYMQSGIRTRVHYQDGKVIHWQRYAADGTLIDEDRAP